MKCFIRPWEDFKTTFVIQILSCLKDFKDSDIFRTSCVVGKPPIRFHFQWSASSGRGKISTRISRILLFSEPLAWLGNLQLNSTFNELVCIPSAIPQLNILLSMKCNGKLAPHFWRTNFLFPRQIGPQQIRPLVSDPAKYAPHFWRPNLQFPRQIGPLVPDPANWAPHLWGLICYFPGKLGPHFWRTNFPFPLQIGPRQIRPLVLVWFDSNHDQFWTYNTNRYLIFILIL